jgi:long-chain fatty acid transport protein
MRRSSRFGAAFTVTAAVWLSAGSARAAGLYFSDRGVRPMGRAGAFVAGADDLGAIWYNPAGIADAGTSVLIDFAYLNFNVTYARQLQIANAENTNVTVQSPTVTGSAPFLPIPTIAWSLKLDRAAHFTIAGGFLEPQIALPGYPSTVNGQPSPARYSLGSYNGSLLGIVGLWAAWKPLEQLRIGAGILGLIGQFETSTTFSTCPALNLTCAIEQPDFDANGHVKVGPIVAPTANGGVIWAPSRYIRFGVSGQLPMVISAPAQLQIQLPSNEVFDTAHVNGSNAHVSFTLPAIARAGIEVRPITGLRIETAYVREFWSAQKSITLVPEGITVGGVPGLATPITVPTITYPRNFQDTSSFRLGGEYSFEVGGFGVDARAGVSYEQSAIPVPYVSILSLDMNKVTTSIGGGFHFARHWRLDVVYAHFFCNSVYVAPTAAQIPHINPLNGNAPLVGVNGGSYSVEADLIGLGANYTF